MSRTEMRSALRKLKRPARGEMKRDAHAEFLEALKERMKELDRQPKFEPTIRSEFAAGYLAGLQNAG